MSKKKEKLPDSIGLEKESDQVKNTVKVVMLSTYIGNAILNAGFNYELESKIAEELIANGFAKRV